MMAPTTEKGSHVAKVKTASAALSYRSPRSVGLVVLSKRDPAHKERHG